VIDSHGEQKLFGSGFALNAGESLLFYVEQGAGMKYHNGRATFNNAPAKDYSYCNALAAIAGRTAVAAQTINGPQQNCPDYNLSKIQKTNVGCIDGKWSNWIGERCDMTYHDIERYLEEHAGSRDIVTIRNRGTLEVTLSEVIQTLRQNGYAYSGYHCSFCRSPQIPIIQTSATNRHVTGSKKPASLGGGVY
jgi:hypothetical protein